MTTQTITTKQIEPYKKKTSAIVLQANELTIKTENELKVAVDYLSEIKNISKKITEEKIKFTEPANAILKRAREIFSPIEKSYKTAEILIKSKILDYNLIQEKKAEKKIETIENKVKEGNLDIVKAAAKIENLTPAKNVSGKTGSVQYRIVKKIVIFNRNKIPTEYLLLNEVLIRKDLLRGVQVPGAKLVEEKVIASY